MNGAVAGRFLLVTAPALLEELDRVLRYARLARAFPQPKAIVALVAEIAVLVEPRRRLRVLDDDADNRVLEAAVEATADFIVTGDRGLLALERHEATEIVSPRSFIERLEWSRPPDKDRGEA